MRCSDTPTRFAAWLTETAFGMVIVSVAKQSVFPLLTHTGFRATAKSMLIGSSLKPVALH